MTVLGREDTELLVRLLSAMGLFAALSCDASRARAGGSLHPCRRVHTRMRRSGATGDAGGSCDCAEGGIVGGDRLAWTSASTFSRQRECSTGFGDPNIHQLEPDWRLAEAPEALRQAA